MPGTRAKGGGLAPTDVAVVTEPFGSDPDRRIPLYKYLQLGAILDGEAQAPCLARQAKGYLIHDDKLYSRNTSGIL
jgi:hypothetical protein